jgi:hypothetical protein
LTWLDAFNLLGARRADFIDDAAAEPLTGTW